MGKMNEEQAKKELEQEYEEAEKLLKDKEKLEKFLQKLEKKLKTIPKLGDTLSILPTMILLVRSYIKKEYTEIPLGTIIAIVGALIYVLNPMDIIPDHILGAGYIDDALVVGACLNLVSSDIEEYRKWREKNNKVLEENL